MTFSTTIRDKVFVQCGRHCCLCHKFCGVKMELHHIEQKADGGKDTEENCVPLCFECHAEVGMYNSDHPKGSKITANELKGHRDKWYKKVEQTGALVTNPEYVDVDKQIFSRIRELLPSELVMTFFQDHDFAGSYEDRQIMPILAFVERHCRTIEFEFLDVDLESLRVEFCQNLRNFANEVVQTAPIEVGGYKLLSPNEMRKPFTEAEEREAWREYEEIRNRLNILARSAYESYTELVRSGRRKLGVP